jgi:hypothetical protein
MAEHIRLARGNSAQWTAANPVLRNAEPGVESDTGKLKIGDGVTAWGGLSYLAGVGPVGRVVSYRSEIPGMAITTTGFRTLDGAPWTHGASSGPMAIQDASGQWWQLDLSKGYAHASWFEAVGDGVADDAAELNAASTAMAAVGGGVVDLSGGRYLVNSADLVIRQGVTFFGPYLNFGWLSSLNYSSTRSSIIVNPTYTIRLSKFSAIKGLCVFKTGLTTPTNLRTAIDLAKSFSGTAITIGDGPTQVSNGTASDAYIGYCFILGFNTAIANYKNMRPHVEYISGDCTNGIYFNFIPDMDHVSHCHFWGYSVAHITGGETATYTVSGAANNGAGLIRLTISANILRAGDTVVVASVGGTAEANGRWTVAAVGTGYIDLSGSTFANAYTSGGVVRVASWKREGAAFSFENLVDWGQLDHCFSYGYDTGFLVDSCNDVVLVNCGADGWAAEEDPTTVAYKWQNGSLRGALVGCKGASHGYGVVQDVGAAHNTATNADLTLSACHFWGNNQGHVHVVTGTAKAVGCHFDSITGMNSGTAYAVTVEGASGGITCIGNSSTLARSIQFTAGGNALYTSTIRNNRWADSGAVGNREVASNSQRNMYYASYGTASSINFVGQNARGSATNPTATLANDSLIALRAQSYDGADFSDSGIIRVASDGGVSAGSTPGKIIFTTTASGAAVGTDRIVVNAAGNIQPISDNAYACGGTGARWASVWAANGTIQTSDKREKADITPSVLGLDFITELRPVSFRWRSGGNEVVRQAYLDANGEEIPEGEPIPSDATPGRIITRETPGSRTHWGLIAQEVKATCDALSVDFGGWVLSDATDPDSQQALRYDQFVGPLIKAVQELASRVKTLESKP